ncbi:ABC transporter permease [Candidatus Lucifugimonas marina]|jgi:ABC-type nitrate/sulfonate/bicarbonate transport system permease component|uniref:ABC transporter permease subunit n=1 Tax=Candidatus Lucifugimonas marina TaxID=3038979 RepID=A0AAJ6CT45_9CHLR|nr:ABC transporter permease subunit [SAR202 cluster bacterium JH702]MDG0868493.1 ABC transporter permease subunit [SAR202 cluster bacterium JH639]WFG35126.1 ABC transporter permease subunit [SAR202 cluster bacterium JH545]WFG39082.1 ABC transporter permease subunit [SAR202 cluster bacterium JH1073]
MKPFSIWWKRLFDWLPAIVTIVALVVAWEVLVDVLDVQRWLLPAPSVIAAEISDEFGFLMKHARVTLSETIVGFAFSVGLAVILASGIIWSRTVERSVYPLIITSQTIPIITLAPLLIIWVGTDMRSKVIVIVLFTFFPIVISLVSGLRSVDQEMVDMFRTMGASSWQTFRKLMIPAALPNFFAGLKVAAVFSVIGAVIGEWFGASAGLGWLMKIAGGQFQTARIFAAIVVLSILAMLLFAAVVAIEKWVLRKYPPTADRVIRLGDS